MKHFLFFIALLLFNQGAALSQENYAQSEPAEGYVISMTLQFDGEIVGTPVMNIAKGVTAKMIVPGDNGFAIEVSTPKDTASAFLSQFGQPLPSSMSDPEMFELTVHKLTAQSDNVDFELLASPFILANLDGSTTSIEIDTSSRLIDNSEKSGIIRTIDIQLKAERAALDVIRKINFEQNCPDIQSLYKRVNNSAIPQTDEYVLIQNGGDDGIGDQNCCAVPNCFLCCGGCCSDPHNCPGGFCCAY